MISKFQLALNILNNYGIEEGKPGSLLILPADNGFDAVHRRAKYQFQYSVRHSKVIN
ncbi:hypothetical protein O9993_06465 [Vibrio lentus]|nr:hypothetical protein [Vibrio lentus]